MAGQDFTTHFARKLQALDAADRRRRPRIVRSLGGGWCEKDGRRLLDFGANNYLDLAHHRRLAEAAVASVQADGVGATASPLVSGRGRQYAALEAALRQFENAPGSIVFPTGYAANLGVLTSVVESRDVVFCDRLNHASLVDACRTSGGTFCVYRSDRLEDLRQAIRRRAASAQRIWIVSDGVFSMDGTVAPLADLCAVADEFRAGLIIDEAHGTGVLGIHGRGATEHANCEDRVAARIGTLSKAVGCLGGFAVGSSELCEWLWNTARTQFFSTALPPSICAAAVESLQMISEDTNGRRRTLAEHSSFARQRIAELELPTVPGGVAPILPIVVRDAREAIRLSESLDQLGYFVPAIRPPTVPVGTSRLRISLSASHSEQHIDDLLREIRRLHAGIQPRASGEIP